MGAVLMHPVHNAAGYPRTAAVLPSLAMHNPEGHQDGPGGSCRCILQRKPARFSLWTAEMPASVDFRIDASADVAAPRRRVRRPATPRTMRGRARTIPAG